MGVDHSAEWWVVNKWYWYHVSDGRGRWESITGTKNKKMGVQEPEQFRVHLELLLWIVKGRWLTCMRWCRDDEHPKSV